MRKAFVYRRGPRLWFCYDDVNGKRHQEPSGLEVGDEKKANEALRRIVARIEAGTALDEATEGPVTVARYEEKWTGERKVQGLTSAADESSRLRLHAMPTIGAMKIEDVRPRHVRDLIKALRAAGKLAPRTVRHVYGTLHTMFRDAVVDELIPVNPCILKRGELPKVIDKDPTWRAGAVFTRGELEQLISDERLPADRRVLWALLGLSGARFGEAAALRWRNYDATLEPLGRLLIAASWHTRKRQEKATKTEQPRQVPVHPVLARILAEWKLSG
jgi:integrase